MWWVFNFFWIFLAQKMRLIKLYHLRKFTNFSDIFWSRLEYSIQFLENPKNAIFEKNQKKKFWHFFGGLLVWFTIPVPFYVCSPNFSLIGSRLADLIFSLPWVQRCHVGGSGPKNSKKIIACKFETFPTRWAKFQSQRISIDKMPLHRLFCGRGGGWIIIESSLPPHTPPSLL